MSRQMVKVQEKVWCNILSHVFNVIDWHTKFLKIGSCLVLFSYRVSFLPTSGLNLTFRVKTLTEFHWFQCFLRVSWYAKQTSQEIRGARNCAIWPPVVWGIYSGGKEFLCALHSCRVKIAAKTHFLWGLGDFLQIKKNRISEVQKTTINCRGVSEICAI